MTSFQEREFAIAHNRQTWLCHWYDPGLVCSDWGQLMLINKQASVLHAAYEFVFRMYYSRMHEGDPIQEGYGIVCVHAYSGATSLVGVNWWLGTGLEGVCRLVDSSGHPLKRQGGIGLWPEVDQWELSELTWGGTLPDTDSDGSDALEAESDDPIGEGDEDAPEEHEALLSSARPQARMPTGIADKKRVLLVEDYPPDIDRFEAEAWKLRESLEWEIVTDGREALAFLRQENLYEDAWRPDLVILNLNLPGLSGMRVLEAIRDNRSLETLPVLIWSLSESHYNKRHAHDLGVNGYFVKHSDPSVMSAQVRAMLDFARWSSPVPDGSLLA